MTGSYQFLDLSSASPRAQELWPSIIVPKAAIDAEIERLAESPPTATGRRASLVVHPSAPSRVPSFTPGIDVTIQVLKPGESSTPVTANSSVIDMCIRGAGHATIGGKSLPVEQFDVWNTPSMDPHSYRNEGRDLFVRLSFSNAPLLEKLEVHYVNTQPARWAATLGADIGSSGPRAIEVAEVIDLPDSDGAQLRGYEFLIDIDTIESKALLWPWKEVNKHLGNVYERDLSYTGRHLYLLYNPATERRMGTSHSFFATIAKYPPGKVDRPHRHTSAAINYYFFGHGRSNVMGQHLEWEAGDLHLSAPGFSVHHHASREQGFCALTIQDHPLHLAMESLLWQEQMGHLIAKLGAQAGFETNIGTFVDA